MVYSNFVWIFCDSFRNFFENHEIKWRQKEFQYNYFLNEGAYLDGENFISDSYFVGNTATYGGGGMPLGGSGGLFSLLPSIRP